MAYLAMMAVKLIELPRVLRPTGSLYLYCDLPMSDDAQIDDDGSAGEGWLTDIVQGGVPQLLLGRHVSRAIARLIAGATAIPAAAFENVAQRIRDDTNARRKVKAAVAAAVVKEAKQSPEVIAAAMKRWTGAKTRRQENREAIAAKALEDLADHPPTGTDGSGPSEDFMNLFEDLAERASSENLRDLFARVLAGEL